MPKLVLKTMHGPGRSFDLTPGKHFFGSTAENDFQLDHPSIAEHHCQIEVTADQMTVRDLGSLSGTYVNGQFAADAKIESCQVLRIGDLEFDVEGAPVKVIVPNTSGPEKLWQREMADGYMSCAKHPSERGVGECAKCHRIWCPHCIHRIGLQGRKPLQLCPECGGMCETVKHKVKVVKKGFWARLFDFFFGWLRRKPKKKTVIKKPKKPDAQPPSNLKIKGK